LDVKASGGEWESRLTGWKPKATVAEFLKTPNVLFFVLWWIQHGHAGQLVAEGGTGKTTILLYLLIAAAAEMEWLGLRIERYGTCVLLSLDDSQDDLDSVLAEIVLAMGLTSRQVDLVRRRVRLISLRGCDVSFTRGGQRTDVPNRIANALSGVPDLVCVALDTQRQFSGGDSNEDRVAMIAAQSVSAIAERLKVTCILTHHVGKGQSRSGVDDMYIGLGSTATPDTLRFVLRLERVSWDEMREAFEIPEGDVIASS
jgi:RecA-family ATPase